MTNSTQRHPGPSVSTPPRSTPAAEASPATPPQTPSAVLRSLPSLKVVVSSDSAAGSIIAAPRPCARRAPTSTPALPANPPISEDSANSAVPATQDAAAAEQVAGPAAEQHETAVGEQVAAEHPLQALHGEVQVARGSSGSAMLTIDASMKSRKRDRAQQGQRELAAPSPEKGWVNGSRGHG